ncbi:unnamed protein product [Calypogeia fissa]
MRFRALRVSVLDPGTASRHGKAEGPQYQSSLPSRTSFRTVTTVQVPYHESACRAVYGRKTPSAAYAKPDPATARHPDPTRPPRLAPPPPSLFPPSAHFIPCLLLEYIHEAHARGTEKTLQYWWTHNTTQQTKSNPQASFVNLVCLSISLFQSLVSLFHVSLALPEVAIVYKSQSQTRRLDFNFG